MDGVTTTLGQTGLGLSTDLLSGEFAVLDNAGGNRRMILPFTARVPVTIGRGTTVLVRLPDTTVHRTHALIVWDDERGAHLLEDPGGSSGTFLDGQRITQPEPLTDGARIRLGTTELLYRRRG